MLCVALVSMAVLGIRLFSFVFGIGGGDEFNCGGCGDGLLVGYFNLTELFWNCVV